MSLLESEFGVSYSDAVAGAQHLLRTQTVAVDVRAVGRVHVLYVDDALAVVQPRVAPGGIRVVDADVVRGGASDAEAGAHAELGSDCEPDAALDHQPARV